MKKEKEETKPITVKKIFQVIFIVVSFFIGLLSIVTAAAFFLSKYQSYLGGILSLIVALLAFLPKKITRIPYWARALACFAGWIFIIIAIGLSSAPSSSNPAFINHSMQENFTISNFYMIIYNATETTSISSQQNTTGYFVIANAQITNFAKGTITLDSNKWYYLMDNQNRTYEGSLSLGLPASFQPNLEEKFYFIFEVPKTAQGLKLYFIEDQYRTHVVDLQI